MPPSLTPDWRSWVQTNLQRNCSIQSMVEAMVAKNFDPTVAASFIATVSSELKSANNHQGTNYRLTYDYEPPIFSSNRVLIDGQDIKIGMRLDRPEIVLLENVLTTDECDELVRRSQARLKPSTTVDPATGEAKVILNRTSSGTYFHLEEDEFVARLDQRLAALVNWPLDNSEGLQILHYQVGGQYKPHFDFFPPEQSGSSSHTKEGGQRIATIVMYLNEPDEGGETIFPEIALAFPPRKGAAVYFRYCNAQGQVDRLTLHGGAPVRKGEKWIATKWIRQERRR